MKNPGQEKVKNPGHENLKKVVQADQILESIAGKNKASRSEFVKLIWKYIKGNKLQDRLDGRFIIPDQKLATLMGSCGERINAFKMMHYIEAHLIKPDRPFGDA